MSWKCLALLVGIGLGVGVCLAGCSDTAVFAARLAGDVEAKLDTNGRVHCDHRVQDVWLCSYEPDLGSNSYAEVIVRRGTGDCWTARRGLLRSGPGRPYSPHSYSFGLYEAFGPKVSGCA